MPQKSHAEEKQPSFYWEHCYHPSLSREEVVKLIFSFYLEIIVRGTEQVKERREKEGKREQLYFRSVIFLFYLSLIVKGIYV